MNVEIFILALGLVAFVVFGVLFRLLPRERWQVIASIPRRKNGSGRWEGANLTYYGLITATACALASAVFFMLGVAAGVPLAALLVLGGLLLAIAAPSARLVARAVERKPSTLTVGGAVFVTTLVTPIAVFLLDLAFSRLYELHVPLRPVLAALTIAYVIGEGVGRLACISFGCCYGKPVDKLGPRARRVFERLSFTFHGETKKIAYAGGLQGVRVVPVQAMTASLLVLCGLGGMELFLRGHVLSAFLLTSALSQLWRGYSETLRADHRGGGKISAYQWMALGSLVYAAVVFVLSPGFDAHGIDWSVGLGALWDPLAIVVLEVVFVIAFVLTGLSRVTGCDLAFHVHKNRI